jgi:hypothetical protein
MHGMQRNPLLRWVLPVIVVLGCASLPGCVSRTVEEVRQAATGIDTTGDSVVLLGRRHESGHETEPEFVACVGDALGQHVRVIPEAQFIDSLFPWFEPRVAPLEASDLPAILGRPMLADRLRANGVRYLVWIDGSTNTSDQSGAMTCTASPGFAGCFGFLSIEKDSKYEATVWDVRKSSTAGRISADANGTTFVPAVIVPVPFWARVRASACDGMADQLRTFLMGDAAATAQ